MHDIFCDIEHSSTPEHRSVKPVKRTKRVTKKKRKPIQCLVRGNKVFFYGKTAKLIQRALEVTGDTPEQFLTRALKNSIEYYKAQGKLK
jgi:hypothetical protein